MRASLPLPSSRLLWEELASGKVVNRADRGHLLAQTARNRPQIPQIPPSETVRLDGAEIPMVEPQTSRLTAEIMSPLL